MQFFALGLLFAGFTSTFAAPAGSGSAPQQFQADVAKALEPVQTEIRALYTNAQAAADDIAKGISESGSNLLEAGKGLLTSVDKMDRANIPREVFQRVQTFGKQIEGNAKNLLNRAITDTKQIIANERAALFGVRNAINTIQQKYLTPDGQQLSKVLMRVVGIE